MDSPFNLIEAKRQIIKSILIGRQCRCMFLPNNVQRGGLEIMKFVKLEILIDKGGFSKGKEWDIIFSNIKESIKAVKWPPSASTFTVHKHPIKERAQVSWPS
jgi:hypothetical protein